jgi:hypothetical protein
MLLKLLFGIGVLYCIHYLINVLSVERKKKKERFPKMKKYWAKVEEYQNN